MPVQGGGPTRRRSRHEGTVLSTGDEGEAAASVESPATPGALRRQAFLRSLPLVVTVLISVIVIFMGWHERGMAWLIANRTLALGFVADHPVLASLGFALGAIVWVVLSLPGGTIFVIVGGFLFGTLYGGTLGLVAATAGATAMFRLARSAAGAGLVERAGPRTRRIAENLRRGAFNYLLFLRFVPLMPFWLVNVAPALVNVGTGVFIWATLLGLAPSTFAFAFIGAGLDSAIAAQQAADPDCALGGQCTFDPAALLNSQLLAALIALGVVSAIPLIYQRVRDRRARLREAPPA